MVDVSFTPRAFPAPKREVNTEMEEKWAKKQLEAVKKIASKNVDDNLSGVLNISLILG